MQAVSKRHFILGYGSLINGTSRAKTGESGQVWPVRLQGFERHWSVMSPGYGMSSVAVVTAADGLCNGVLVEVSEREIPLFDQREHGYQRLQVHAQQLQPYGDEELPEGIVWIYHTDRVVAPTQECPIALSYTDVILAGCLEHGAEFVEDFLSLTKGWQHPMLNDRPAPRYPRAQPELNTGHLNQWLAKVVSIEHNQLSVSYES